MLYVDVLVICGNISAILYTRYNINFIQVSADFKFQPICHNQRTTNTFVAARNLIVVSVYFNFLFELFFFSFSGH